jgi:hypothetical protein
MTLLAFRKARVYLSSRLALLAWICSSDFWIGVSWGFTLGTLLALVVMQFTRSSTYARMKLGRM